MTKILVTGDLCCNGIFGKRILDKKEIFDNGVLKFLYSSDYVICNLESPVIEDHLFVEKPLNVVSPANAIKYLSERNVRRFTLANNHTFDLGAKGIRETTEILDRNQVYYWGLKNVGISTIFNDGDSSVAFINFCDSHLLVRENERDVIYNEKGLNFIKNEIEKLTNIVDHIVIIYHGGEEYSFYPFPRKRNFLKKLTKLPVKAIVAHHSHTIQGIETINDVPIFYSLGNFVFDFKGHNKFPGTEQGAIVEFKFDKNEFTYNLLPIIIDKLKGIVSLDYSISENTTQLNNFSNYYSCVISDANRVFSIIKTYKETQETHASTPPAGRSNKIVSLLKYLKHYEKRVMLLSYFVCKILKK